MSWGRSSLRGGVRFFSVGCGIRPLNPHTEVALKEVEIRGRLVAARNGLHYAATMAAEGTRSVHTRSKLFASRPGDVSEQRDKWLEKAIRSKSWQRDYLDRCITVGIFGKIHVTQGNLVTYMLLDAKLAMEVVDDFDEHGMLLSKLVVPNMVEISTKFDAALAGKPESIVDAIGQQGDVTTPDGDVVNEDEVIDPDMTVNITARDLGAIILRSEQTLKGVTLLEGVLVGIHDELHRLNEGQGKGFNDLTSVFRSRFNKVESALGGLSTLGNNTLTLVKTLIQATIGERKDSATLSVIKDLIESLRTAIAADKTSVIHTVKEAHVIIRHDLQVLQTSLSSRSALQLALEQLKASQSDTAAAIDILMTAAEQEGGTDAEQSG